MRRRKIWQYLRGKYPDREEIRGAALIGSSTFPMFPNAPSAASLYFLIGLARLAVIIVAVRSWLFPRQTDLFEVEKRACLLLYFVFHAKSMILRWKTFHGPLV